jgi:DNA-binding response OmpR family regulator
VTPSASGRPTVLYIEDDPASLHLVEMLFEQRPGIRLVTALEGRQGLALARTHRPDLILLDFHLQDVDGETLLHALRAEPELQRTPIIVLTAERYSRLPEPLRLAGAQGYLMKPLDLQQFLAEVDARLREACRPGR